MNIQLQSYNNFFENRVDQLEALKVGYIKIYQILAEGTCYQQPNGIMHRVTNLFGYDAPFNSVLDMIEFTGNKDELLAFSYAFERYKRTKTIIDMNVAWKIALDVIDKNAVPLVIVLKQNFNCGTNKLAKKMLDLMVKKLNPNNYDENIELVLGRFFQIEGIRNKVMGGLTIDLPKLDPKEIIDPEIIYLRDIDKLLDNESINMVLDINNSFKIQSARDPVIGELYLRVDRMRERNAEDIKNILSTTRVITSMSHIIACISL